MFPRYDKEKGMLIKGHYWLIHPKTGEKWSPETVATFIDSHQLASRPDKAKSKLLLGVKNLVKGIKVF